MKKLLSALAAFCFASAAAAFSMSGNFIDSNCDNPPNIHVPSSCSLGVQCTSLLTYVGGSDFQMLGLYILEQNGTTHPLEIYGTHAVQNPPSCVEGAGYDCGRMKFSVLSHQSGDGVPSEIESQYEFAGDRVVYFFGGGANLGLNLESVRLQFNQTRTGRAIAHFDYLCNFGGVVQFHQKDFVIQLS